MQTYALPSINVTSRTFTPGVIPETVFEAQNGATSYVRFGNTPIKTKLSLVYQNISEDDAFKLTNFYNRCIIDDRGVRIGETNNVIADIKDPNGMESLVRGVDSGLDWRFVNPPTVEAQIGGRYNVSIELIGILTA